MTYNWTKMSDFAASDEYDQGMLLQRIEGKFLEDPVVSILNKDAVRALALAISAACCVDGRWVKTDIPGMRSCVYHVLETSVLARFLTNNGFGHFADLTIRAVFPTSTREGINE